MRFSTVTLAFLFFTTVFATPIFRTGAGDVISLARRTRSSTPSTQGSTSGTSSKSSAGRLRGNAKPSKSPASGAKGKTPCNGKRATLTELQAALHPNNIGQTFSPENAAWRRVYKLKTKVDGKEAIVKIGIIEGEDELEDMEREVTALKANHQFLGWGHSRDKKLYYIVMEYMGVALAQTPETFKGNKETLTKAKKDAIQRYHLHFGLTHTDSWTPELGEQDPDDIAAGLSNESNWTYKQVGGVWQAELIDWDFYEVAEHVQLTPASAATAVDLGCDVFVPAELEKNLG